MLNFTEFRALGAGDIASKVAGKQISPLDVVRSALAAIAEIDPILHAFTAIAEAEALAEAASLERRIMRGDPVGPLAGVAVAVKDLVLTKGLRTTFGSRLYENYVPDQDDIAVERLRRAGAIIIGKTNVAEFGYGGVGHNPLFPTTRNPWNPALTSGGSSAGSAVAVATGICPIAIGSDGGGSIRLPASFNGIFGMKASMGRVPLWPGCRDETLPGVSGWESIEHVGPLARSVADAALMLSVIAGPDPRDRHSIPSTDVDWTGAAAWRGPLGLRVAYCPDWGGLPLDPEVRLICDDAAAAFASELGCVVEVTGPPFGWEIEAFRAIVAMDTDIPGLRGMIAAKGTAVGARLQAMLDQCWTADQFIEALGRRRAMANAIARFMERYDLLLTPTVSCLPFPADKDGPGTIDGIVVGDDSWTPAAFPSNLTGQPAASVPAGFTQSGLPVGLQIMGRHLADASVLQAAAAFEMARPWAHLRPAVDVK